MRKYISQFVGYLKERNLSPRTIESYENNLNEFWIFLGRRESIRSTTRSHIRGFLVFLADKANQPVTRRAQLIAIRSFFRYLEDENVIKNNPTKNLPLPRVVIKEPAFLQESEIRKLLQAVKKDKRAEVAIRILVETGFRLSELTGISVEDIDTREKTIKVNRKGNIEQILPINSGLAKLIKSFVKNKNADMPLITNRMDGRMTQRRVAIMVQDYLKKAGVARKGISVHSLRHSYCVRLLEKGASIQATQILLGHKSIATTERYMHLTKNQLAKEVRLSGID